MRRALTTAVTTVALLGACSFGGEDPPSNESLGGQEDVVDSGGLPQSCDELVTPLSVAAALNGEPAGGRSAAYTAPNPDTGAVVGMTCSFGVGATQPAVTVEAVAYSDPERAAEQFAATTRLARRQSTGQESLEVGGSQGLLTRSVDGTACYLLDGRRTLRFTVSSAAAAAEQARDACLELAQTVVDGISSTEVR